MRNTVRNVNVSSQTRVDMMELFKLCREAKKESFIASIKNLQKRGAVGALINQPDPSNHGQGNTLIHVAVQADCLYIVDTLLNLGANPAVKNDRNETPAHTAARAGNLEILKYLVDNGGLH